jgi:hypothetical protein
VPLSFVPLKTSDTPFDSLEIRAHYNILDSFNYYSASISESKLTLVFVTCGTCFFLTVTSKISWICIRSTLRNGKKCHAKEI